MKQNVQTLQLENGASGHVSPFSPRANAFPQGSSSSLGIWHHAIGTRIMRPIFKELTIPHLPLYAEVGIFHLSPPAMTLLHPSFHHNWMYHRMNSGTLFIPPFPPVKRYYSNPEDVQRALESEGKKDALLMYCAKWAYWVHLDHFIS